MTQDEIHVQLKARMRAAGFLNETEAATEGWTIAHEKAWQSFAYHKLGRPNFTVPNNAAAFQAFGLGEPEAQAEPEAPVELPPLEFSDAPEAPVETPPAVEDIPVPEAEGQDAADEAPEGEEETAEASEINDTDEDSDADSEDQDEGEDDQDDEESDSEGDDDKED